MHPLRGVTANGVSTRTATTRRQRGWPRRIVSNDCAAVWKAAGALNGFVDQRIWTPAGIRLLAYALVLVHVVQTVFKTPTDFARSYWLISYQNGFVRRGLSGELAILVHDWIGLSWQSTVSALMWIVASSGALSAVLLIELLVRRASPDSAALAVILASSPFVVGQFLLQRRPDVGGFVLLVVAAVVALARRTWRRGALAGVGLAFGVLCLAHEAVLFLYLPAAAWTLFVVASHRGKHVSAWDVLLLVAPAIVTTTVVLTLGRANAYDIAIMVRELPLPLADTKLFSYLDDDVLDSIRVVATMPNSWRIGCIVVGLALFGLTVRLLRRYVGSAPLRKGLSIKPRGLVWAALMAGGLGVVMPFATGIDWMRWVCVFGSAYLVICAVDVLGGVRVKQSTIRLPRRLIVIAVTLTLLPPMPEIINSGGVFLAAWPGPLDQAGQVHYLATVKHVLAGLLHMMERSLHSG